MEDLKAIGVKHGVEIKPHDKTKVRITGLLHDVHHTVKEIMEMLRVEEQSKHKVQLPPHWEGVEASSCTLVSILPLQSHYIFFYSSQTLKGTVRNGST